MATEAAELTIAGKRWVEETLQRIANELKIPVEGLRWRDDFPGPYLSSLYFNVREARQNEPLEFRLRQLEDCANPANRPARGSLEDQIRNSLREVSERLKASGEQH
jgi:hypothetical protein